MLNLHYLENTEKTETDVNLKVKLSHFCLVTKYVRGRDEIPDFFC